MAVEEDQHEREAVSELPDPEWLQGEGDILHESSTRTPHLGRRDHRIHDGCIPEVGDREPQRVEHVLQQRLARGEVAGQSGRERRDAPPALPGHRDQHATPVTCVTGPRDQASLLESAQRPRHHTRVSTSLGGETRRRDRPPDVDRKQELDVPVLDVTPPQRPDSERRDVSRVPRRHHHGARNRLVINMRSPSHGPVDPTGPFTHRIPQGATVAWPPPRSAVEEARYAVLLVRTRLGGGGHRSARRVRSATGVAGGQLRSVRARRRHA